MDLALRGRTALVCAASKGLGKACAMALAQEGVVVTITARTEDVLRATAAEIEAVTGTAVHYVVGDIATEAGREAALSACRDVDILVNNAGGPPPGDFRDWDRDAWVRALDANMLAPIALIKALLDGMIDRRFGRIVNITSSAVKAPIDYLGLSNGARCGLTGFVAGLARQVVQHNVTINNILPGPFATDRMRGSTIANAKKLGIDPDTALKKRADDNPAKRFGDPAEFGMACAFLCSSHSGYINGQNLLLDGGAYPGTF